MKPLKYPTLPPKYGYVEVEKDDGTRTYMNTETGVLIEDEPPTSPPPVPGSSLERVQEYKLIEAAKLCETAINAGTEVQLPSGDKESFTYSVADQANVSEMFTACLAGASGYLYHPNGGECRMYTAPEIIAIYSTLSMYKTGQITYQNQLKQYIMSLETPEEAIAVVYGQPLDGVYLENYNSLMEKAKEQMDAVLSKIIGTVSA